MPTEDDIQEIDIRDAFLRIHDGWPKENGLEKFNQFLTEAKRDALATGKKIVNFVYGEVGVHRDYDTEKMHRAEQEQYVADHPQLAEMHLTDGSNLLHILGNYKAPYTRAAEALIKLKPSLMEEKAGPLGFTPAFSLVNTGLANVLMKLLDAYDPIPPFSIKEMDAAIAIEFPDPNAPGAYDSIRARQNEWCAEHAQKLVSRPKCRAVLNAKDTNGNGLPFYCSAHEGSYTLDVLHNYGVDIFAGFEKAGEPRGVAIAEQPNILGTACTKFRQNKNYDEAQEALVGIARKYINEFGIDALRDLVRSNVKLYAPMMGTCYQINIETAKGVYEKQPLFEPDEMKQLLLTLSYKEASTSAKLVVEATHSDQQPQMRTALNPVIHDLQPDRWARLHEQRDKSGRAESPTTSSKSR